MAPEDERIALFLDYENLAIGARDGLGVSPFDFGPVADALAPRVEPGVDLGGRRRRDQGELTGERLPAVLGGPRGHGDSSR